MAKSEKLKIPKKEKEYKGVSNLSLKDENKLIHEMFRAQDAEALKRDVITDYPLKKNQGNKKKEKPRYSNITLCEWSKRN